MKIGKMELDRGMTEVEFMDGRKLSVPIGLGELSVTFIEESQGELDALMDRLFRAWERSESFSADEATQWIEAASKLSRGGGV